MPTPPFDAALENALKDTYQSGELHLLKQWVDTPAFFCCISGNTVGVAKDPVCVLSVDRVVCTGDDVELDFSGCWSPTDSLAGTAYTIRWGEGTVTNGNFPNPRNAANETETLVGGYEDPGFYDITIDIQDTLGATRTCRIQIYAEDCGGIELDFDREPWTGSGVLIGGRAGGPYYTNNIEDVPPLPNWVLVNDSVNWTCSSDLIDDMIAELESDGNEYLYVLCSNGISRHPLPPNAGNWSMNIVTADQMATAAGVDLSDYWPAELNTRVRRLRVSGAKSSTYDGWQWCLWQVNDDRGSAPRHGDYYVGVAQTRDGWATIHRSDIVYHMAYNGAAGLQVVWGWGLAINQWELGGTIFVALHTYRDHGDHECLLFRSVNSGAGWAQVDNLNVTYSLFEEPEVFMPISDHDGDIIYWTQGEQLRGSINGGNTFSTLSNYDPGASIQTCIMVGPVDHSDLVNIGADNKLWEYDGGVMNQILPNIMGDTEGLMCMARNGFGQTTRMFWITDQPNIKISEGGALTAKEGNWIGNRCKAVMLPEVLEWKLPM